MLVSVSSHLNYTPNLLMSQSTNFCIIYFDLRMDRNPEAIRIKKTDYRMTTDGKIVDMIQR
jgi:hypothetical protein